MKRLAILGASGHGKVVADIARAIGWDEIDFYDDSWPELRDEGHPPVTGSGRMLVEHKDDYDGVVIAIGDNDTRCRKFEELPELHSRMVSLIHPRSIVSPGARLAPGTVVMPGAVINSDTDVGLCSIINSCAVVEHDCRLGDFVHVSPNAAVAGGVTVGHCSWIGLNSSIRQQMKIGNHCVIGAGAVVVHAVSDGNTVVGNPATVMRHDALKIRHI